MFDTYTITVYDEQEVDALVEYEYEAGDPGSRWEEPVPESLIIYSVSYTDNNGTEQELVGTDYYKIFLEDYLTRVIMQDERESLKESY